jgi:hypothetical protein
MMQRLSHNEIETYLEDGIMSGLPVPYTADELQKLREAAAKKGGPLTGDKEIAEALGRKFVQIGCGIPVK